MMTLDDVDITFTDVDVVLDAAKSAVDKVSFRENEKYINTAPKRTR